MRLAWIGPSTAHCHLPGREHNASNFRRGQVCDINRVNRKDSVIRGESTNRRPASRARARPPAGGPALSREAEPAIEG